MTSGLVSIQDVGPKTEHVVVEQSSKVLHVRRSTTKGTEGNGSREKPFGTIQEALKAAGQATEGNRIAILVASGEYPIGARTPPPTPEKNSPWPQLQMVPHVDLFGGYDNTFTQRDILMTPSVLDGGGASRVVIGADDARLDGFVITGGASRTPGAGILCDHASPTISNNVIHNNIALEPEGFVRDLIHQRGTDGAGIAVLRGSNPTIRNNLIYGNKTEIGNGAGLWIENECPTPKIDRNVFLGNEGGITGYKGKEGSRSSNGGAIAVSKSCHPEITGNVIVGNRVYDNSDGGGVYLEYDAHALMKGNWVVGNRSADDGGGIYIMKNSQPNLERNIFMGNHNTSDGSGGIRLSKEGRLKANHNLIAWNPGTIDAVSTFMVLANNTLVDATNGTIIFENESPHLMPSRLDWNLIAGTGPQELHIKNCLTGPPVFENNLIRGGHQGTGNVDTAPDFLEDGVKGEIVETEFDPATQTTRIRCKSAVNSEMAGGVIRVDGKWSVIKAAEGSDLVVWGAWPKGAKAFEIIKSYQPANDQSPSARYGAYAQEKK